MFSTVLSGAVYGIDSYLAHVEVDLSPGLPCFVMVGNLSSEVKEAGERVRIVLKNSGIQIPPMHIAVNISPGEIRKTGTGFDLPIAVAVLAALGRIPADSIAVFGGIKLRWRVKACERGFTHYGTCGCDGGYPLHGAGGKCRGSGGCGSDESGRCPKLYAGDRVLESA